MIHRAVILLVLLVLLNAEGLPGALLAAPTATITGVVTDLNGKPLADIDVFAEAVDPPSLDNGVATTTADGRYTIPNLGSGTFRVRFRDAVQPRRYVDYEYPDLVTLPASETRRGINAKLAPTGRIQGRVTDLAGQPLAQTWITAWAYRNGEVDYSFTKSIESAADGSYTVAGLMPGRYRVSFHWDPNPSDANPSPYPTKFYPNAPTIRLATDLVVVSGGTVSGIDMKLEAVSGGIAGMVTGEQGEPIQYVTVAFYEDFDGDQRWDLYAVAVTDGTGAYRRTALWDSSYRVEFAPARNSQYGCAQQRYADEFYQDAAGLAAAMPVVVQQGQVTQAIDAQLAPTGRLRGQVIRIDDTPFHNLTVRAYHHQSNPPECASYAYTDAMGRYELALPTGSYTIRFGGCFAPHCAPSAQEYYDNADTIDRATVLTVRNGQVVDGINARFTAGGAPEARPDRLLVEPTTMTSTLTAPTSVLANDFDFEADPLTATLVQQPITGTVILAANGFFTYTYPVAPGSFISDTFTYRASDGVHTSNLATVTLLAVQEKVRLPVIWR